MLAIGTNEARGPSWVRSAKCVIEEERDFHQHRMRGERFWGVGGRGERGEGGWSCNTTFFVSRVDQIVIL